MCTVRGIPRWFTAGDSGTQWFHQLFHRRGDGGAWAQSGRCQGTWGPFGHNRSEIGLG